MQTVYCPKQNISLMVGDVIEFNSGSGPATLQIEKISFCGNHRVETNSFCQACETQTIIRGNLSNSYGSIPHWKLCLYSTLDIVKKNAVINKIMEVE